MLRRILIVWLIANFALVGLISWLAGGWYLAWPVSPVLVMVAELGLIMLPNLVLPILVLRFWWPETVGPIRQAVGWQWTGWRSFLSGTIAFIAIYLLLKVVGALLGNSIPYNLPGTTGEGIANQQPADVLRLLAILFGLVAFVGITVAGEETMFRGWIQTKLGQRYGVWIGIFVGLCCSGCVTYRLIYSMRRSGRLHRRCGCPGKSSCMFRRSAWDWRVTLGKAPALLRSRMRSFLSLRFLDWDNLPTRLAS